MPKILPSRRTTSIQSQLSVVIGLLLGLGLLVAVTGYASLRNYQAGVETTMAEAIAIRELSLRLYNEFLLARQAEADLMAEARTAGFATLTAYTAVSRRHLASATAALDQMDQRAKTAHDPELQALVDDIDRLRPQLHTYEQAFLTTVNAIQQRSSAGGLESELNGELEQLEKALAALPDAKWRLLALQIRTNEQAYFNTGNQENIDNARLLTNKLIAGLADSTTTDLTATDGHILDRAELTARAERALQIFTELVRLEQDIKINRKIFEDITLRINQIIGDIGDKSDAGLARARANLTNVSSTSMRVISITAVLAIGLGALAAVGLSRRITHPLTQLSHAAEQLGRGRLEQRVSVRGGRELEILAEAFNTMADRLRQTLGSLEQQVADRTRDLERRAAQIATGAEIARVATTLLDPNELIASVVDLIQQRFDLYYVGLFLLDAEGRYAVLQAGTGEAGRIMKERGHRLEVGGQSMIGWVCANKQARIALDVGKDAVRFANPYLPETHSELALPMRAGNRIIGALSIQSTRTAAFDEGDIAALQGMADQIAVALENARLFQQTQETLQKLDEANRLLTRQGWQEYLTVAPTAPAAEFYAPGSSTVTASGSLPHILRIPLELGGQSLGTLIMERSAHDQPWTDEEVETIRAIAHQAMLTLDNARLFEESQRLAARERLIGEITSRIRSAATLEGVLNSAVREIGLLTGASYAAIDLELVESAHQAT